MCYYQHYWPAVWAQVTKTNPCPQTSRGYERIFKLERVAMHKIQNSEQEG